MSSDTSAASNATSGAPAVAPAEENERLKAELDAWKAVAKTQNEYIAACRKHIALLNEGNGVRGPFITRAGRGFPQSYKTWGPLILHEGEERQSAERLSKLDEKLKVVLASATDAEPVPIGSESEAETE